MRLLFLITAWIFYDNIYVFLPFYAAAAFLDGMVLLLERTSIASVYGQVLMAGQQG
jgi:hypothetical protein